ncbi:MAG: fused MFS/spermidine synthase [Thermoguttaceae bacterium]|jgi:spermidine synthase
MQPAAHDAFCPMVPRHILFLAVSSFGVSAFMTQLVLMRELLAAFSGNELIFGIVLGNWMLLTGIGSALGKTASWLKSPITLFVLLEILIALVPLADVFLLRTLRNVVFIRGAEAGLTETVASCFALMAPYCLATGYLLTLACMAAASDRDFFTDILPSPDQPTMLCMVPVGARRGAWGEGSLTLTLSRPLARCPERGQNSIGQVYFFDNLGGVLGGILFTFVLIRVFSHFGILYFPAVLNLAIAALVALSARRRLPAIASALLAAGLIAAAAIYNLDDITCNLQYGEQKVVYHGASPYGMLVVTKDAGQYNFIENGLPLFSTHNIEQVEETVHYAMAQRPDAKNVLLISGGASGTAREILKYPAAVVDYVELDPLVLEVARRFLPEQLNDFRIHVINADGRQYVKQTGRRYDVVIVDAPDPSTSQINRLYTREFFDQVHRVLALDGVLSFSLGGYEASISKELARLIAVADRTLAQVYKNVLILPGTRNFFLASDGRLTTAVADRIEQAGIPTRLVNRSYLNAMLTPDRMADVRRVLSDQAPTNEDFNPILYFYHLRYWISQFTLRFGLFEAGLVVILIIYLARLRPVPLAIFSGGFAASALEVVLLLGFQILHGCVYHQVGLIITMFMLGLGIGSLAMNRLLPRFGRNHLAALALAITIYSLCVPYILIVLGKSESPTIAWISWPAVPVMTLLLAVLVGMEFPLAGKVGFQDVTSTAARLYTADYIGAALGALLVSTLLIPVLGVTVVCLLAAGLNFFSAAVMIISGK